MRLRELLESAQDEYLYWITPEGETIECSTHEATAAEHLGIESEPGSYAASNRAWTEGWIRVAAGMGEFGCDPTPNASDKAKRALVQLVRRLPDFETYYVGGNTPLADKRSALAAIARGKLSEAKAKPTIEQIVAKHATKVKDPFNKCGPISRALANDLVRYGYPARVIRCSELQPYAPKAHKKWLALGSQMYWVHYVVRVGDTVFDLTRRQFFPESPQPFVQSWADFSKEWDDIGIDWAWHRDHGLVTEAHHAYDNPGFDTQYQPLKAGDTLRVFHGFRDSHDAMLAATRGLSGASRAKRVYSYEADNNPKGLFVTLSLKVADEFAGAYGVQCIMEFNVPESDLEAPVWPGGSYTVQGGYSQYFGHGAKGRAGRRQAQRGAEAQAGQDAHHLDAVKQSDRKHLATMLFQSREAQALYVGHLNPSQIAAFHVRPSGSGSNVPWERISREEFIQRYQNEITIPKEETWKERVFEPNEPFNGEKFMAAMKERYKDHAESGIRNMWFMSVTSKRKAATFAETFDNFLWPRQMPEAIRWFAKTLGTKPGADD